MKMNNFEQKVFDEMMKDLESNTYTREEIVDKKMARAVNFFVNETSIKSAFKSALYMIRERQDILNEQSVRRKK